MFGISLNRKNSDVQKLERDDIIDFILIKFSKGAECFNGDWWGRSNRAVIDSDGGYDVHVFLKDKETSIYYAEAYPLIGSGDNADVKLSISLVESFELNFHIIILKKDDELWHVSVYFKDQDMSHLCGDFTKRLASYQYASMVAQMLRKHFNDIKKIQKELIEGGLFIESK